MNLWNSDNDQQINNGFNFQRLLIGNTDWSFLLEAALRAGIVYLMLTGIMRLMGKRMAGQMSRSEISVIVTLGAAVGAPLQAPDRGLLPAFIVLLIAVIFQRGTNLWSFYNRKVEIAIQGDVDLLVKNGELVLEKMKNDVLPKERLYSFLRQSGIIHLGQIERAYLEADGHFSIFRFKEPRPGLAILPQLDDPIPCLKDSYACSNCGHVVQYNVSPQSPCQRCKTNSWASAICVEHYNESLIRDI